MLCYVVNIVLCLETSFYDAVDSAADSWEMATSSESVGIAFVVSLPFCSVAVVTASSTKASSLSFLYSDFETGDGYAGAGVESAEVLLTSL